MQATETRYNGKVHLQEWKITDHQEAISEALRIIRCNDLPKEHLVVLMSGDQQVALMFNVHLEIPRFKDHRVALMYNVHRVILMFDDLPAVLRYSVHQVVLTFKDLLVDLTYSVHREAQRFSDLLVALAIKGHPDHPEAQKLSDRVVPVAKKEEDIDLPLFSFHVTGTIIRINFQSIPYTSIIISKTAL